MAISRERRTALAELMTASMRIGLVKLALKDENETDESICQLMATAAECIDRAMAALKS